MVRTEFFELYRTMMDSAVQEKFSQLYPLFPDLSLVPRPSIISIGAGTGKLEKAIAGVFPQARILALDYSLPMIEAMNGADMAEQFKKNHNCLLPILADAQALPLADDSCDVLLACSVVHEIISFRDYNQPGKATRLFFHEAARVLRPKGRLLFRDFVQPENPEEKLILNIGTKQTPDDEDPANFLSRFLTEFKGNDLGYIRDQIPYKQGKLALEPESKLLVTAADAAEIVIHYAWAKRFEDEVRERYAYFPLEKYAQFILSCFASVQVAARVVGSSSILQPGYPTHINGRFSMYREDGTSYPLPPFTGVIAVEKQ